MNNQVNYPVGSIFFIIQMNALLGPYGVMKSYFY